jgi:hypothetical protein
MRERARPSRVNHPSPRHQTMHIARPVSRGERYWPPRT